MFDVQAVEEARLKVISVAWRHAAIGWACTICLRALRSHSHAKLKRAMRCRDEEQQIHGGYRPLW